MTSLEGWGSTIELHPRGPSAQAEQASCVGYRLAPVPARQAGVTAKQNANSQPERSRVSPESPSLKPLRELGKPTGRLAPFSPMPESYIQTFRARVMIVCT
jgi:hypothetical protein